MFVLAHEVAFLNTAHDGSWLFTNLPVCVFRLGHLADLPLRLILLYVNLILQFLCQLVVLPISWCGFFIVSMVFTIWYIFGVAGTGCSLFSASFRSSCKAGIVVTKSLSNCLSIKDFISSSFIKLGLTGYEILGCKFFSLRILNIGPHFLLAYRVSAERSAVSLMGFPLR